MNLAYLRKKVIFMQHCPILPMHINTYIHVHNCIKCVYLHMQNVYPVFILIWDFSMLQKIVFVGQ